MKIRHEMVEYIRTMVRGDYEENDRFEAQLDAEGWDGFPSLLGVIFFLAVNRKLGSGAKREHVIRFVAQARAAAPDEGRNLDVEAAERLVTSAIDPRIEADVDPEVGGAIQGMVIMHALSRSEMSDDELDALLREAVVLAERY